MPGVKKGKGSILERRETQVIIVLFLLAFLVRYHFMGAGLFHTDSVIGARAAEDTIATGRLHYLQGRLGYPGEAILNTLTFAVFRLFGAETAEYSTLFSGVLFGALCVPVIYLLTRKLFDSDNAGIYAALILTFFPIHLSLSTYGKGHGMELFFLLTAGYLALLAGQRKTLKLKILAACVLGFTLSIRQTSALVFPAFLLFYFRGDPPVLIKKKGGKTKFKLEKKTGELAKDLALLIIPVFIIFYAMFLPKMLDKPDFSLIETFQSVGAETNRGFGLFTPMLTLSLTWATVSVTELGWLAALSGIYLSWKKDKLTTIALVLWFLFLFFYLGNLISTSPRFVIPAMVIPIIFSSVSLDELRKKYGQQAVALVLIVLIIWMMRNIYDVIDYRSRYCGPCEFSKRIAEVTEPDSVIIAMDESQHYEYYSKRRAIGHPSGPDLAKPEKIKASLDLIDGLLRNGTGVYATTQGMGYDVVISDILAYNSEDMMLMNRLDGQVYANLRFDIQSRQLFDRRSGAVLPLTGMWGLGLYDRFTVLPVMQAENEDWHHKGLTAGKYTAVLYKITLREDPDEGA
ncbi:glycosyltransferase family 39 protein [Candidatus Altiarchaeota archaeon]